MFRFTLFFSLVETISSRLKSEYSDKENGILSVSIEYNSAVMKNKMLRRDLFLLLPRDDRRDAE